MRSNHKNQDILSQTKLICELIASLLMKQKAEVSLKIYIFWLNSNGTK